MNALVINFKFFSTLCKTFKKVYISASTKVPESFRSKSKVPASAGHLSEKFLYLLFF